MITQHSRRFVEVAFAVLWKWRSAVDIIGYRQVGVIAVLDNGRSGDPATLQEAHHRIPQ